MDGTLIFSSTIAGAYTPGTHNIGLGWITASELYLSNIDLAELSTLNQGLTDSETNQLMQDYYVPLTGLTWTNI